MVKTYNNSIFRMFKSNIVRLLAVSLIIAIGISIVTGICGLPEKMREAIINTTPTEQTALAEITANKVELLGFIFPIFFIAVAALTALTTITRLVEEERSTIACLKTLGYSNASIIVKYVLFAFVCACFGCVIGVIIGNYIILPVLYDSVTLRFNLAASSGTVFINQGLIWSAVMCAAVIITSLLVSFQKCKDKPAFLLRAKAPKSGKKIILEYFPFIWKRLKFKYKSSVRNIFRFKSRLIMTLVSVIGSTMMLFCGTGLYSSLNNINDAFISGGFIDSIMPISILITIFAVALAILVLFNLTNINIEERKREIATLKVLGYSQFEVAGYVYREIAIISIVGIIIGVPLGYYLLGFVFDYIGFGSLNSVKWYIWLITAALALLSVMITDLLLYWKIKKIDMTSSLKTID